MRKIFTSLLLVAVLAVPSFSALNKQRISPQEKDIKIYHTNKEGLPTVVSGELMDKVAKGTEIRAVHDFFETNKAIYQIDSPQEEIQLKKIEIDELGMTHLRMQQTYKGLEVIGGDMTAHFRNDGMFTSVNGQYTPIKNIDIQPVVQPQDAVNFAENDLRVDFGEGVPTDAQLVIFPWQKENILCWRFFILSDSPMGRWEYFVSAKTGDIIFKANRIMNAEEVGTGTGVMGTVYNHMDTWYNGTDYELVDYTRRLNNNIHGHNGQMSSSAVIRTYIAGSTLPGTLATDADNIWGGTTQSPAVDGHMMSALVYDWMLNAFGRNSYNDNGSTMTTSVNYSAEGNNNAYWNGAQIVVWSWGTGWRSLAGCPDVIAHEWAHAITETTSGLIYQKESGALNESFSDMMGAAFEFAHDTLDSPDWFMGENGIIGGTGFRSMSDPHSKFDPDYYGLSDPYWVDVENCTPTDPNDWCGVHTNSGVGNKWFYLLSDGGTHHSVTVNGLGVDTAIQIAFRANTVYWTANSTYSEAAAGTILAAHDLDPSGNWEAEVMNAWEAVGVSLPAPTLSINFPNGTPVTLVPNQPDTIDVSVYGLFGGAPVANSGELHVSINGGLYTTYPMTEVSTNNYQGVLPGVPCGDEVSFYVSVEMQDPELTITNGTFINPYKAVPFTRTLTLFEDDFETNKGWTIASGAWQRGIPSGGGGEHGNPDPTSGSNGPNVLGFNLSGDYSNNMPEYHTTSPAIDCSNVQTVNVQFSRWLGVEQPAYDHAYIRVSTDNMNWITVWENPVEIADGSWVDFDVDITAEAASQPTVYIRFVMGTTDGGWKYCGWNIDDFKVTGTDCSTDLSMTTTSLPDWTAGHLYSEQLVAINGSGTLNWSDKNNDLVGTGLSLSSSGLLSGVVPTDQIISFVALVTDDFGSDELPLSFEVNPEISILSTTVNETTEGIAFNHQFSASGGTGTLQFSDKDNDLNTTGLSVSSTGLLDGSALAGNYNFILLVSDLVNASSETAVSLTVNPAIDITTTTIPDVDSDTNFDYDLFSTGGTGNISWSDKNNELAAFSLSLDANGHISGYPTIIDSVSFTAVAEDDLGATDEQVIKFRIVQGYVCGDFNGDDVVDISDLVFFVEFMFNGGPQAPIFGSMNMDGSSDLVVDISDLVFLVEFMFNSGAAPICGQ